MKTRTRGIAEWVLRVSLHLCPENSRDWLTAMAAEMNAVGGDWPALRWAFGAVSVATKCRVRGTLAVAREELAMNRASAVVVLICLAIFGLLFLSPSFRQATSVAPATVRMAIHKPELGDARLREMSAKAEKQRDAQTLAFVAMNLSGTQERLATARRAIAIDPQLTWVLYFVPRGVEHDPALAQIPTELMRWDPDNALPYLMAGEWMPKPVSAAFVDQFLAADSSPRQAQWRSLMEKAFAAPRFDDYLNRRFELTRKVMLEHGLHDPTLVASKQFSGRMPEPSNVWRYAQVLLHSGDTHAYETVERFGAMIMGSQSLTIYVIGDNMRHEAMKNVPSSAPVRNMFPFRTDLDGRFFAVAAAAVQIGLLLGLAAAFVLIAGVAVVAFRTKRFVRIARRLIPASAVLMVLSASVAAAAYIPFRLCYDRYLHERTAAYAVYALAPFDAFRGLPSLLIHPFVTPSGIYYLWWLMTCVGTAVVLWRGVIHARRVMKRSVAA